MKWISVKESMPKAEYGEGDSVLTVSEKCCSGKSKTAGGVRWEYA